MLSEIRKEDLEETDIYIYRRSTGQLLSAIKGLVKEQEIEGPVSGGNVANPEGRLSYRGVHENETIATFGFTSMLVGAVSDDVISSLSNSDLTDKTDRRPWITSQDKKGGGFTKGNKPDGLRPGEVIQVIAINRATGYIGTQDIVTQPSGATLNLPTPIEMGPPNLKIIATREFIDNNELTGSKDKIVNLIGNEGAGLTSDTYIKIQSIWLDQNGDTLPDDLPGYTGRLAISKGGQTQARNPDIAANFPINPGYDTKLVKLNNAADLELQHFYLQVVGGNINDRPTFESPGAGSGKLQTRPKKYVPLLVPIFDEPSTRSAEEALAIARIEKVGDLPDEVEPVYRWAYRPEMQFSVYTLTKQKLKIERGDGGKREIDLTKTDEDLLGFLIEEDLNFVKLLYDLGAPASDPLEQFSGDDELIFSIGASEAVAEIKSGGMVHFESTKHLDMLASGDLLTIRLYQNNDSANVLWDYNISGIYAFYKIPHVERSLKKTKDSKNNDKEFRILGGTRTKFTYYPEPGEEGIEKYAWSITKPGSSTREGTFLESFKPTAVAKTDTSEQVIYWEPDEWRNDHSFEGTLTITLTDGSTREKNFEITTRTLRPRPGDEMEGSDVEILNTMLFNMGLSHQMGFPGVDGDWLVGKPDINGDITTNRVDLFSAGNLITTSSSQRSEKQKATTEKIVRRLQSRDGISVDGIVGNGTLQRIKAHWIDYHRGYDFRPPNAQQRLLPPQLVLDDYTVAPYSTWVNSAVTEWRNIYTAAIHGGISRTIPQEKLFHGWLSQECEVSRSGGLPYHWGAGNYDYRITEGAGDEAGSIGCSQIVNRAKYHVNAALLCNDLSGVNLYKPDDNVRGMAIYANSDEGNCGRSFYRSFILFDYDQIYINSGNVRLVGIRDGAGATTVHDENTDYDTDDTERMTKAIMGYNAGQGRPDNNSWPGFLTDIVPTPANKGVQPGFGVSYALSVKRRSDLPFRHYIWKEITPNPQDSYCFEYGESQWVGGNSFATVRQSAAANVTARVACP